MPTKWAHFRISEELYERARAEAEADRRSLSNWFALTVERALAASAAAGDGGEPLPEWERDLLARQGARADPGRPAA